MLSSHPSSRDRASDDDGSQELVSRTRQETELSLDSLNPPQSARQVHPPPRMRQSLQHLPLWQQFLRLAFFGGLSAEDRATLKHSKRLLAGIFQAPDLPKRPYSSVLGLGCLLEFFHRRFNPLKVEKTMADYEIQLARSQAVALQEATVRVRIWKQLCQARAGHLTDQVQAQLENTIQEALMKDPVLGVERSKLISEVAGQGRLFKQQPG